MLYGPTMGLTSPTGAFGVAKQSMAGGLLGATSAGLGPRASVASLSGTSNAAYELPADYQRLSSQQLRM